MSISMGCHEDKVGHSVYKLLSSCCDHNSGRSSLRKGRCALSQDFREFSVHDGREGRAEPLLVLKAWEALHILEDQEAEARGQDSMWTGNLYP